MLLEGRAHSFDLLPKSANRGSPGALLWLKGEKEKEEERWTEEGTNYKRHRCASAKDKKYYI